MLSRRFSTFLLIFVFITSVFSPIKVLSAGPAPLASGGLSLVRSDDQGVVLSMSAPDYKLTPIPNSKVAQFQLTVPGASSTGQAGWPELPVFTALLGAPAGAQLEVSVVSDDATPLEGAYALAPAPHPERLTNALQPGRMAPADPGQGYAPQFMAQAGGSRFYPTSPAHIAGDAWMRDQRILRLEVYPFQYDAAQGALLWHRNLQVEVRFIGGDSSQESSPTSFSTDGQDPYESIFRESLLNYDSARLWRTSQPSSADIPLSTYSPQASLGPRYRIAVDQDGIYRVSYQALQQAGMAVNTVDPTSFHMVSQGQDVAIAIHEVDGNPHKFSPGEYLTFYGQKFRGDRMAARYASEDDFWPNLDGWQPHVTALMFEKYTDENVYWLLAGGAPGPRMGSEDGTPQDGSQIPADYEKTVRAEQSNVWYTYHFTSEDTWFWDRTSAVTRITNTYTTTLSDLSARPQNARLQGEVVAKSASTAYPDHHTLLYLNNDSSPVDDASWDGPTAYDFSVQFDQSILKEGENDLHFVIDPIVGAENMYFNWFSLSYGAKFLAENDRLAFTRDESGGPWQYQIGHFDSNQVEVYNISDPLNPKQVNNVRVGSFASGYRADFQANHSGQTSYIAVGAAGTLTPKSLSFYQPPDLFSSANGADYIFIAHHNFLTATQALADYRAAQGMRTRVIDIQDLYNEFSDGIYTPLAIKSFLAYTFAHWQSPAPAYVLLIGSGHWNFKGYPGDQNQYMDEPIYIPPNLEWVDPWQGEVDTASMLAAVVGNDILPDLSIGRIPVSTPEELQTVIQKTIAYEQDGWHSWQRRLLFVTDNTPDEAGNFPALSDAVIANHVSPFYNVDRLYMNDFGCPATSPPTPCPQVTRALTRTLNQTGTLVLNYVGHGAVNSWATESILKTTADPAEAASSQYNHIVTMNNADQLPVMLSMTCLDGYWDYPSLSKPSLAVEMIKASGKGAVATFSPTGLGVVDGHDALHDGFYDSLFQNGVWILGPATQQSKLTLYATGQNYDLISTFTVFGDPALHIKSPYQVTLTPASSTQVANAGTLVNYNLQVKNGSIRPDTFQISVEGNLWTTTVPTTTGSLSPGESVALPVSVQIPVGATTGDQDVARVTVRSQGDLATTASASLTTETPFFAVELSPATALAMAMADQPAEYTLQLKNTGNQPDSFNIDSSGGTWPMNLAQLGGTIGPLAPGQTSDLVVHVTPPAGAPRGSQDTVTIQAVSQADPSQQATASLTTQVGIYDASLAPNQATKSAAPGQVVSYIIQVENSGDFTDSYNLSASGLPWQVDFLPQKISGLQPGGQAQVTVSVHVPAGVAGGSYPLDLSATSAADPAVSPSATLTTVLEYRVYLPLTH